MKHIVKQEKGVTMIALVITVVILITLTNMLVYNAKDSIYINKLTDLYNDIDLLREKVSEYYNEYGKVPAEIKYTNISQLSGVISQKNDTGDFYVIDLEAMQGITLRYGKDYEKIKNDKDNADKYADVYIINQNSHNIFYVQGVKIEEDNIEKTYYTDYTEPDETTVDLRYVDGILIPEGYYYHGKEKDNIGNESIVIREINNQTEYIWQKQISIVEKLPDSIKLSEQQTEEDFIKSVNCYKGYFKNKSQTTNVQVIYLKIDEEKWSEIYTKECEYTDVNGDIAYIPQGFRISMSQTMSTIAKGLVAKDKDNNEWVWIEVPKTVFETAKNDEDYDNIKKDLVNYSKSYRNGDSRQTLNWDDEYYEGCGITSRDKYIELYNKMLKSIYSKKGFWISRYEIGDSTSTENNVTRTSNSGVTGIAVSKPDQVPYNYITCSQAQELASKMNPSPDKSSSLLFGIQWDLVCRFLEEKSILSQEDINSNSTSWGNYLNSSLMLNRGKYNIDPSNLVNKWIIFSQNTENHVMLSKTSNNETYSQLLTTGASEETNIANIYDFAGNLWEFTLEYATSLDNYKSSCRGGIYYSKGNTYSASARAYESDSNGYYYIGFRTAIY